MPLVKLPLDLQHPRMSHACGVITLENNESVVIVPGGLSNAGSLSSSEILYLESGKAFSDHKVFDFFSHFLNLSIQTRGNKTVLNQP